MTRRDFIASLKVSQGRAKTTPIVAAAQAAEKKRAASKS
jgi:hypothetical protein